jgi:hypothetical protein
VYSSPSQIDYYLANQQQQGDELTGAGLEMFRSGSEPRFFGLKKAALSGLISSLRGPPGIFLTSLIHFLYYSFHYVIF